jgi:peptidoglycan glycosyltransferase
VNRQIGTLFRMAAVGVALLITMTAYWQIWAASSLASRRDNARLIYRQLQIKRGLILASDGRTVLARNHAVHRDGLTLYERRYPYGPLFAHAIGYNTVGDGRTGLELAENPYLTASNSNLATVISNLSSTLQGETVTGDNVITSLSVHAQRAAEQGLTGQGLVGAVVAMEPRTGRVVAMYSSPSFNPTRVDKNFARLNRKGGAPLLNRATQGLYAPGSTFKIVTATGALNAGFTPQRLEIDAQGHCITDEGHALCNAGTESYGTINLETALTNSVNTYFAQLGQHLGQTRLEATMRKFGFFQLPQFTYPTDEMNPSGLYSGGRLIGTNAPIDVGRVAIGQERLAVTPLQMAEVAATVGNGGVRMAPSLVDKVVTPSGHTAYTGSPQTVERVMSTATASQLATDMQNVVDEGTGQAARLPNGLSIAGKTGTAETGTAGLNTAWFIAFAPVVHPKIAVAVVVEHTPDFGGQISAPIAAKVIEAYLGTGVAK